MCAVQPRRKLAATTTCRGGSNHDQLPTPSRPLNPEPAPHRSIAFSGSPLNCPLHRIDRQLVRCDNLTGAGVAAPLFIPEL